MRKWLPFRPALVLAFLVQVALVGWLIADRALLLQNGQEVRLAVRPIDPRDLLRGDYVVLAYDISQLESATLDGDDDFTQGDTIHVALARADDAWHATAITHAPPADGIWIRGAVTRSRPGKDCGGGCRTYQARYDIEKFFVPEGTGRELETLRNAQKLAVDVAVGSDGRAALKRLLVDGEPRYEEQLL